MGQTHTFIFSYALFIQFFHGSYTLLDLTENRDNFKARTERVNFGLFGLNSDFTGPNLTL